MLYDGDKVGGTCEEHISHDRLIIGYGAIDSDYAIKPSHGLASYSGGITVAPVLLQKHTFTYSIS